MWARAGGEGEMNHEWLIREIEGLRDFARRNGLERLAEALDQARLVALIETAALGRAETDSAPDD